MVFLQLEYPNANIHTSILHEYTQIYIVNFTRAINDMKHCINVLKRAQPYAPLSILRVISAINFQFMPVETVVFISSY
jgi:hypothetical protein